MNHKVNGIFTKLNLLNLVSAYIGLYFFMLFMMENIEHMGSARGYANLILFMLIFSVLFFSGNLFKYFKKLNFSFVYLIVFITYFIFIFLFSSLDFASLKQATVGTTGGIIFALMCGIFCSLIIAKIYQLCLQDEFARGVSYVAYVLLLVSIIIYAVDIFIMYLQDIRGDVFLIQEQKGYYQRSAVFILMVYMILTALGAMHISLPKRLNRFMLLTLTSLLFILAMILVMLSQLLGSNSGMVTVFGFLLLFLIFISMIRLFGHKLNIMKSISLTNLILSSIGLRYFFFLPTILFLLLLTMLFFLNYLGIQQESLRIFGFGSTVSSIENRLVLFSNFTTHFNYNPLFGNMIVETLTTGEGTYVHSLFSLLSHVGIFGTTLFILFLYKLYYLLKASSLFDNKMCLYTNRDYILYRMLALTIVVVFCTFSAFFTWMPLWFAFGLFGLTFRYNP